MMSLGHRKMLIALTAFLALAVAAIDQRKPWRRLQLETLDSRHIALGLYLEEMQRTRADESRLRREALRIADDALESRQRERDDLSRQLLAHERKLQRARLRPSSNSIDAREARIEVEAYTETVAELRSRLDTLLADRRQAEQALDELLQQTHDIEIEVARLERDSWWRRIPGLRYLAPSLEVRQLEIPTETQPRIERCVTCHLTMADDLMTDTGMSQLTLGTATGEKRHPSLELIARGSAHDLTTFGCVSCHGGDGQSTDLARSGHVPPDTATAEQWRRDWGWRRSAVTAPILTGALIESGCASCHGRGVWAPQAPAQQRGRRLVTRLGCADCHTTGHDSLDNAPRQRARSLADVAATSSAGWVARYLAEPRNLRPESTKALYWRNAPEDERDAEIAALVTALWRRSRASEAPDSKISSGDPDTGQMLFESLACRACHSEQVKLTVPTFAASLNAGELSHRRRQWLTSFLIGASRPGATHRPNLRLSAREAGHLTAFLTGEETSTDSSITPFDSAIRDRLLLDLLEAESTIERAQGTLESLGEEARTTALGDRLLRLYGCVSCHFIPGLEAPPAASDLSNIGERLAASLHRTDRAPADWLHTGDHNPAADHMRLGKVTLTADDSQALFIELLGWRSSLPWPQAASARPALAEGRAVLERHSCRACHQAEGAGGGLAEAPGTSFDRLAPRLRPDWVTAFLRDPQELAVRPWIASRMPRFDLTSQELDAIAEWFAARAEKPRTAAAPPTPAARDEAVGKAVFGVLQCARCHGLGARPEEASDGDEGLPAIHLAPSYALTSQRLRPEWVTPFLLDPLHLDPETAMPPLFPRDTAGALDASYLVGSLKTPMFDIHRQRLLRHFEHEEDLWRYLADPERTALAVRAHLWTLDGP